ncbi:hypothetical protein PMAYCL1PPCAC_29073, partial [Pristionchus mayeri]
VQTDRDELWTRFIIFGSILTSIFVLILVALLLFIIQMLPSSPIPPSPPESLRAAKAIFTPTDDKADSIYEPIGVFSPLSVPALSKQTREEEFTEIL